ncbi:MAG: LUD domain-containing protein [Lentimicrobiaceae bacterium]|jgi:L-lactate dehydrogenase complex protein LldF|nr:LUD domain-containing protein [Lentimicrobiaceae bacterium]
MSEQFSAYIRNIEKVSFDKSFQKKWDSNIEKHEKNVLKAKNNYNDVKLARLRAAFISQKSQKQLDDLLIQFDSNFTQNGGKVLWARNSREAVSFVLDSIEKAVNKKIICSKSFLYKEIDLENAFKKKKITCTETNLDNFILQSKVDKSPECTNASLHLSKSEINEILTEKYGLKEDSTPEEMIRFMCNELKNDFDLAGISLTGANFLLADIGGVVLIENEGNILKSTATTDLHIVLAGIDKIIPSIEDLDTILPLLSTYSSGQLMTAFSSITTGAAGDENGPQQMIVILVDNNRSELLSRSQQRAALACIKCGSCQNVCPVYRTIGSSSYGVTYSGPIGIVIEPIMKGFENYGHLSFACTMCKKCDDVCPVNIPLSKLIIKNREEIFGHKIASSPNTFAMKKLIKWLLSRRKMDLFGAGVKNYLLKHFFAKQWGNRRQLPVIQTKSFSQQWREKNK